MGVKIGRVKFGSEVVLPAVRSLWREKLGRLFFPAGKIRFVGEKNELFSPACCVSESAVPVCGPRLL